MGIAYPTCIVSLSSFLSFTFYVVTRRLLIVPISLITMGLTLPFFTMTSLMLGRYIRDYPHLYRNKRDIREWLNFKRQNPYLFKDKTFEQRHTSQTFHQQRTQEFTYVYCSNFNLLLNDSF